MPFKVNDIVEFIHKPQIKRIIIEAHETYYLWSYIDVPDKVFDSRNSNDPLMELWKKTEYEKI